MTKLCEVVADLRVLLTTVMTMEDDVKERVVLIVCKLCIV